MGERRWFAHVHDTSARMSANENARLVPGVFTQGAIWPPRLYTNCPMLPITASRTDPLVTKPCAAWMS